MPIPALIAGGAALAGGILANASSARQARAQMAFQERMSSTAHQREVADLRAAGLNPILSGLGGHGASTPPGAMGQVTNVGESAARAYSAQQSSSAQSELAKAETEKQQEFNKIIKEVVPMIRDGFAAIRSGIAAGQEAVREAAEAVEEWIKKQPSLPSGADFLQMMKEKIDEMAREAVSSVGSAVGADRVVRETKKFAEDVKDAVAKGVAASKKHDPELSTSGRSRGINPRNAHQRYFPIFQRERP